MNNLLLYLPAGFVILFVIAALKEDDIKTIFKKTFKDLSLLTAIIIAASCLMFFIDRML